VHASAVLSLVALRRSCAATVPSVPEEARSGACWAGGGGIDEHVYQLSACITLHNVFIACIQEERFMNASDSVTLAETGSFAHNSGPLLSLLSLT
jgi:hypothetical protein